MRTFLKSKIKAKVTNTNLNYDGSITIDKKLMAENGILPYEQVHVFDMNNGERFITYAIEGEGISLNGACARLGLVGDEVIILTYEIKEMDEKEWVYLDRIAYRHDNTGSTSGSRYPLTSQFPEECRCRCG